MRQRRLSAQGPVVGAVDLGCMGMTTAYDTNELDDEESVCVIHRAVELGVALVEPAFDGGRCCSLCSFPTNGRLTHPSYDGRQVKQPRERQKIEV
jgi:hypothetical protein